MERKPPRELTLLTHSHPQRVRHALAYLLERAAEGGVKVRVGPEETELHGLRAADGLVVNAPLKRSVDLCVVLGGDGSILRGLRLYAKSGVPVYGVNFGEVGFLATVEGRGAGLEAGIDAALDGAFGLLRLPAIGLELGGERHWAFNDIAVHRKVGGRVAHLAYLLDGEELGDVRCDGLVVSTPAGSTGYNLANGGPVLAWGVEGYAVSFIAPHSLTARPLVVAPAARLTIVNSSGSALEVTVDGRTVGELAAGGSVEAGFSDGVGTLAQRHGSTFYRRLREKFGLLAR